MPVIPAIVGIAEAVGGAVAGALGAVGAGIGVTGAGVTAGMSIAAGALTIGAAASAATSIATAAGAFSAKPSLINPNPTPTAAQTVDNSSVSNVNNLGRAALIMTSGQGVQGSDPSSRYALLGTSNSVT
jgi:hypothetical protein